MESNEQTELTDKNRLINRDRTDRSQRQWGLRGWVKKGKGSSDKKPCRHRQYHSMVIIEGRGGAGRRGAGISGGGRRLDLGCEPSVQYTDDVLYRLCT